MASASSRMVGVLYAATILISAFLLFQVQPVLSKFILPWFGGTPAVWTTCVVFFQTMLFAGYAYAHLSHRMVGPRLQCAVHLVLLAVAVWMLPIAPEETWKPGPDDSPALRILALLAASVGLPYFVLSATGPLVSAWFSRTFPDRSPYRLYALSNLGSLAALLSYPFLVEPRWDVFVQAESWAWGFGLFALLCAASAVAAAIAASSAASLESAAELDERSPAKIATGTMLADGAMEIITLAVRPITWKTRLLWMGLPAFATLALLATTNVATQDVAVVPFLWVLPLSLYLLSFIICFDHPAWYSRRLYAGAFVALLTFGPLYFLLIHAQSWPYLFAHELTMYFAAMFCICMTCHGELMELRPAPQNLTGYYLSIAAGGALGGLFVSLIAPLIFNNYYEWILGLVIASGISLWLLPQESMREIVRRYWRYAWPIAGVALLAIFSVGKDLAMGDRNLLWQSRNFFGVITVTETSDEEADPAMRRRLLSHGRITHGMQFLEPSKRRLPTSYYSPESGVGQTLSFFNTRGPIRVAAVGLGTGTVAVYAKPGDVYRFYEINPQVVDVAQQFFTHLTDCLGTVEYSIGDARLSMEREQLAPFEVIVLDAFSSDAIPTHLLTTQAFDLYGDRLASGGAICVHVSNQYLDLTGVVRRLAEEHGYHILNIDQTETAEDRDQLGVYSSVWMVLTKSDDVLRAVNKHLNAEAMNAADAPLWTDQKTNLFEILR